MGRIFQPVDHILAIDEALLLQPGGELLQSGFEAAGELAPWNPRQVRGG